MVEFSEYTKHSVGKREIARYGCYQKFLLFPVFKRHVLQTHKNMGLFGKELRVFVDI